MFTEEIWLMTLRMDVLEQETWTHNVSTQLKKFEDILYEQMTKHGWDGIEDVDSIQWTFSGALFYSIIVITTIGKAKEM